MLRVFVYFNLHKKLFSIKSLEGIHKGKVIGHTSDLVLKDCEFKVSEAGRQRVLKEKRKNVHAGVVGFITTVDLMLLTGDRELLIRVTYNPYKLPYFHYKDSNEKVLTSEVVQLSVLNSRPIIMV